MDNIIDKLEQVNITAPFRADLDDGFIRNFNKVFEFQGKQ